MPRFTACILAVLALAPSAGAQSAYTGSLSAGSGFMVDADDPDPSGSFSFTAALERRRAGKAFTFGVEAGRHHYLAMRQNLAPDVTGWASVLEDDRTAWRVTPFARWQTRGEAVRLYGQVGAGLYVLRTSYFQQERQSGALLIDTRRSSTDPDLGFNLGVGLELFPLGGRVGIGGNLRSHDLLGGDGFLTAELGIVLRLSAASAFRGQ